ncbi:hypothetical protein JB92DRAFT_348503 [Gautieria morchelliformis]|nr:hypothetical protein JB92DRAFT_348503 [Gautieria morchelliformis]
MDQSFMTKTVFRGRSHVLNTGVSTPHNQLLLLNTRPRRRAESTRDASIEGRARAKGCRGAYRGPPPPPSPGPPGPGGWEYRYQGRSRAEKTLGSFIPKCRTVMEAAACGNSQGLMGSWRTTSFDDVPKRRGGAVQLDVGFGLSRVPGRDATYLQSWLPSPPHLIHRSAPYPLPLIPKWSRVCSASAFRRSTGGERGVAQFNLRFSVGTPSPAGGSRFLSIALHLRSSIRCSPPLDYSGTSLRRTPRK